MGVNVMSDQYNQIGKIIGCTIADLRKNEGLTQKDFSKIFNVSESSIAHYEQGLTVPSAEMLMKFADYFGVNIDYLFGRCSCKIKYSALNEKVTSDMTLSEMINIVSSMSKQKRKYLCDTINLLRNANEKLK